MLLRKKLVFLKVPQNAIGVLVKKKKKRLQTPGCLSNWRPGLGICIFISSSIRIEKLPTKAMISENAEKGVKRLSVESKKGPLIHTLHLCTPPRVLVPWRGTYLLPLKSEINSLCAWAGATGSYANIGFLPANPQLLALGRGWASRTGANELASWAGRERPRAFIYIFINIFIAV